MGQTIRFASSFAAGAAGEEALLTVAPRRGLDVGAGPAKSWKGRVQGGEVGVVLDCRGRPIELPRDEFERAAAQRRWLATVGAIAEEG